MELRRVVITGIGVTSPIGNDRSSFWNGIVESRSGAGAIKSFDASGYRTRIAMEVEDFDPAATVEPKSLRNLDRYAQFAVVAAAEALEDAGVEIGSDDPRRFGVITGSGIGGLNEIEATATTLLNRGPTRISPFFVPKMMINAASGQIAIQCGFQGPNFATASACASSQHALGLALDAIAIGRCDVILAGGSEAAVTPLGIGGFCAMKALSTRNEDPATASRPFTKSRDGFVMGEGGGIFVFEAEERARARGAP
ncbi:MAG: beta-ketoacyl synthase N-terminal-like domain-containing protein, partial [Planctomycetota bacterium]